MYDLKNLSVQELLCLTIKESTTEVISKFPTLKELSEATPEELSQIKGLGPIKAKQLLAAIELGKRAYSQPKPKAPIIRSPKDVYDLLGDEMKFLDREHFKVINLNTKNHVLAIDTVSVGTLSSSLVHPREVFKMPIKRSAAAIIVVHNHPSGLALESTEDKNVSKRLMDVGKIIGVELLDSIIIGHDEYCSLKEKGLL